MHLLPKLTIFGFSLNFGFYQSASYSSIGFQKQKNYIKTAYADLLPKPLCIIYSSITNLAQKILPDIKYSY